MTCTVWGEEQWMEQAKRHRLRLEPYVLPALARKSRQEKHPVYDFLFEYYSFRPGSLLRWSPGPGVRLGGPRAGPAFAGKKGFIEVADGVRVAPFPATRLDYLRWATHFLETTSTRPPAFACLGLHEWAMVYRSPELRHPQMSLRLPAGELERVLEEQQLCCTHYDAYRFFTSAARPRNELALSRETTTVHDQRGCIHVNMDLYRFCYKIYPWLQGELLADAFLLAVAAREIDMRASPYDLRRLGYEPIPLETSEGRGEYVRLQRQLAERAHPVRADVLAAYHTLLETFE
jgi:hypothetical protein